MPATIPNLSRRQMLLCAALLCAPRGGHAGTVGSAFGDVVVPDAPRRIVTLDAAGAIALNHGLVPVGATEIDPEALTPEAAARLGDIPLVGQSTYDGQLRFERILTLRPDLIVGMIRSAGDYAPLHARLSRIAPTVLLRSEGAARLMEVSEQLAQVMGIGAAAAADRADYTRRLAQMRARWGQVIARGPIAAITGGDRQVVMYTPGSWAGRVLGDLGASLPSAAHGDGNGVFLSYEQFDLLAGAQAIVFPLRDGQPAPEVAPILTLPGFRALPAVARGHSLGISRFWPETHADGTAFLNEIAPLLAGLETT